MVKDRLLEFQKKAYVKPSSSSRSRTSTEETVTIRLNNVQPTANEHLLEQHSWEEMDMFLKNVEVVREKITEMNALLQKIREIHKKIQSSPGVASDYTSELNEAVSLFKDHSRSVSNFIQGINKEVKRIGDANDAVSRIKKDQARTVTRTFQNVLVNFNNEQVSYKEQCEKRISTYLSIAGLHMDQDEVDKAIETGELFNTTSIMMAERDKKQLFEDVRSRHEDILKLEASIRELHEIFQDMAMLIESQGEIVDRIETNVGYAVDYTKKARTDVHRAKIARNRNIKLKIAAAICIVITIIVLFIILSSVFCLYLPFVCK